MKEDEGGGWNKNLSGTGIFKPAYGGGKNSEYKQQDYKNRKKIKITVKENQKGKSEGLDLEVPSGDWKTRI